METNTTILHIIDTTGPGGAETVFIELADRIQQKNCTSIVVVHGEGWVCDELRRRGLQPIIIKTAGSFDWRLLRSLYSLIKQHKVDLIQAHLLGSSVYGAIVGLLTSTPVISTFHGMVDVQEKDILRRLKYTLMKYGVKHFACVSHSLLTKLVDSGFIERRMASVVFNGIDTSAYQQDHCDRIRKALRLQSTDRMIGALGNIRSAKGYDILLDAFALLAGDEYQDVHLCIAGHGSGELFARIQQQQSDLGLQGRVHFLGYCEDSAEFLQNIDYFVLPSTSEGFSISTIEALAAGLPVIATRCGGPEEILKDGVTGRLVEVGSASALAAGIKEVLDNAQLSSKLSQNGQAEVVERFDINVMVEQYLQLYGNK